MQQISKTLAGICAFLFVITGAAALLLFNVEQKAFSSETYKQVFRDQGLYQKVPALLASVVGNSNNSSLLGLLDQSQLETVISTLVPPQQIETMTDEVLDSTFDFINGKTDEVTVSLSPFKQNMVSEAGVQAFQKIIDTQPECTAEQLLQIGLGLLSSSSDGLLLCKPPQEVMGLVTPMIGSQLQFIALGIPDRVTLVTADQLGANRDFRRTLSIIRLFMVFSPILPVIFLLGIALLAVRSLNEWLRWWGVPLFLLGMLGVLVAITGAPIVQWMVNTLIAQSGFQLPTAILSLLPNIVGAVARQILNPIVIEGMIILVIGAGMSVMGFFLKQRG